MDKQHIVVTFNPSSEDRKLIRDLLESEASITFLNDVPAEQRGQYLEQAHVLLSWNFPREIRPQDYSRLQQVRFIQLISAGADHMPFAELPSHILIASNAGAYAVPMAEHVLALTLALAKRLLVENEKLKQGEFDQFTPNRLLAGSTAGILGFGGIGRATARLMRAFGMKIYAINTSGSSPEPTDFLGTLHDLEHVLRESDVLVISLPLTKATQGLIGQRELEWMKPDAILVNVARGAIIDEGALYNHVKSHSNFRVGIDAWWTEPFRQGKFRMEYPFLDLPNVIGSPHNSALVSGAVAEAARQAAENVKHFLKGEKVIGMVRREDYMS
ncbi:MAG TPA: 2-hydroxyacid dehydrogenase [Ktedonobacteraceae bacterium]|jgi:glycerate dehydrogenase|nr:2-hydroxyacid dehydrogenase [Ktedonobacteraceae bacterium]